ncbi:MAG: hypothetical protein Q8P50_08085 [Bacillota bacterium]|nr:hypothetical protein [Bacillota bacterium]
MKKHLSRKGVPFEERNSGDNPKYEQEISNMLGYVTYPVTVCEGYTIVGYKSDDLDGAIPVVF